MRDLPPMMSDSESAPVRPRPAHGADGGGPHATPTILRLADAERIAAHARRGPRPVLPSAVRWPAPSDEILDLPEPMLDGREAMPSAASAGPLSRPPRAADARVNGHPANDGFDHATWTAELRALLERPLQAPPVGQAFAMHEPSELPDARRKMRHHGRSSDDRQAPWSGLLLLTISTVAMAAIVGGAAFALSSPRAGVWFAMLADWVGSLRAALGLI